MRLREDERALEALPLRLMIISVVASMSVLPAAQALETLESKEYLRRADLELAKIASVAQILAIEGPGSIRAISLDFSGGGATKFSSMSVGDTRSGRNASSIVLHLSGGAIMARSASDPVVWLCSKEGAGLRITSPEFGLRMATELAEGDCRVTVSVV